MVVKGSRRATHHHSIGSGLFGAVDNPPLADNYVPLLGGPLPVYNVSAVAQAIGVDVKQLDNILSRNSLTGVDRRTRGVARRISTEAAITLQLACDLAAALEVPVAAALRISQILQRNDGEAVTIGRFASLRADVVALRVTTVARLDAAVELVGRRRRGRPPGERQASGD